MYLKVINVSYIMGRVLRIDVQAFPDLCDHSPDESSNVNLYDTKWVTVVS